MRATIRDVAREAGVSVATVSRVLNESGPVSVVTRQRILDVAHRLRYVPNSAARSLITRRTGTLGVLLPDLHGEFFSEVIRGIDQTAQESGYHLLLSSSHNERAEVEAALRAMRGRVDGLVIMSPDADAGTLTAHFPERQPVVLLNCDTADGTHDAITIDNAGGARAMMRHLVAIGHRDIAFIGGPARNSDAVERLACYRAALADAGLAPRAEWVRDGDFDEESGFSAATTLLAGRRRPTAIFAANDAMAMGAIGALRDAGVAVPDEIAVTGFDDIPIARYASPPLTTVRVATSELGARAMAALLDAVERPESHVPRRQRLPATLVVRRSCGAEPSAARDRPPPLREGSPVSRGAAPRRASSRPTKRRPT